MSEIAASNVLILFYSRYGLTERLAVLLAEGALQGGANIRLRRCRDIESEETVGADATWKANRDRMHDEFAAPRLQDVQWADVVAFGTPATPASLSLELAAVLNEIAREIPRDVLLTKGAAVFSSTYSPAPASKASLVDAQARLLEVGFLALPTPPDAVQNAVGEPDEYETARVHGRYAASMGRKLHTE